MDFSAISDLTIVCVDKYISINGQVYTAPDSMWDSLPNNLWSVQYHHGKVDVQYMDVIEGREIPSNVAYNRIDQIPFASSFDWTPYVEPAPTPLPINYEQRWNAIVSMVRELHIWLKVAAPANEYYYCTELKKLLNDLGTEDEEILLAVEVRAEELRISILNVIDTLCFQIPSQGYYGGSY